MVRYKRYKRRYRASTRSIMMKFQSFMDISTDPDSMQIITISAGGKEILKRLAPQFGAYKYYKIGNVAVKLVPASTLPVDPTGLSYSLDEGPTMTVDPRDQLTPGMMRITNGEDIFEDITGLSDAEQHAIYNNMLLDPRWFKWMLQSGVKRHATPRYWQIGQLHQDKWPGAITNIPMFSSPGLDPDDRTIKGTAAYGMSELNGTGRTDIFIGGSSPYGFFQTGHRGVLGWLPTDGLQTVTVGFDDVKEVPLLASPPEVEVMKILLPKAYKTRYYYRMFVTETVYFREPIVNLGLEAANGGIYRPLDIFHSTSMPKPVMPDVAETMSDSAINAYSGGNNGDD